MGEINKITNVTPPSLKPCKQTRITCMEDCKALDATCIVLRKIKAYFLDIEPAITRR